MKFESSLTNECVQTQCGIPVFCEKPLTDSWSSSVSLARDLATAGATSLVQIGFQRRFDPPLVKVRCEDGQNVGLALH